MKRQTKAIDFGNAQISFIFNISCFIALFFLIVLVLEPPVLC